MKLFTRLMLVLAILLSTTSAAFAREVKGNVVDSTDEPLIGVSVTAGQNKTGVSTDIDGNFTITVPNGPVTLKFSYVGYNEQTVNVAANQSEIKVVLQESSTMLEETVVIGYGVQKKVNLTGAVTSVDGAQLENRPAVSVSNMLQGAVAGLNVTTSSGVPGQSASVNVRGQTSINGGSPLVMIDGAIGELDSVNPNDVESISVIKDASAAAVYGARAAYGVILITTKSGQAKDGNATVRFNGRAGWDEPTTPTDFISQGYWSVYWVNKFWTAQGQAPYCDYNEHDMQELLARVNDKTEHPDRPWVVEEERNGRRQWVYYGNYDRYHMMFRDKRPTQQYNISFSGGKDKFRYFLSGGIDLRDGMLRQNPDKYRKYNMRSKIDFDVNKYVNISNNTSFYGSSYSYLGNGSIEDTFAYSARHGLSCFPFKNPDGSWLGDTPYLGYRIGNGRHIIAADNTHRNTDRKTDFNNTFRMTVTPIEQLSIVGDFTYRFYQTRNTNRSNNIVMREYPDGPDVVYNSGAGQNHLAETMATRHYYSVNAFATYKDTFADAHNVSVMGGFNYEKYTYKRVGVDAFNITSETLDDVSLIGPNAEGVLQTEVTGGQNEYALEGVFGRANYDYKGKYLAEFSCRYDGTSRFGKGHRWGFFPSASVGWRMSEENFFAPIRQTVNNLKIRLSYGHLGNQQTSSYYNFIRLVSTKDFANFNFGTGGSAGKYTSLDAPIAGDLTWETAKQWDLGLDFSMFNSRLNFTGDIYRRDTDNMLTDGVELPAVYGASVPKMNIANMRTDGYELGINWNDSFTLFNNKFTYNVGFNLSQYKSTITKFQNDNKLISDYYEGQVLGEIWGYSMADRYFASDEEAAEYASKIDLSQVLSGTPGGWKQGDCIFLDTNGDGIVNNGRDDMVRWHGQYYTSDDGDIYNEALKHINDDKNSPDYAEKVPANSVYNSGDRKIIGNSLPRLQYGFTAGFQYFGFDASVFFQGTGNHNWYPQGQSMPFWGCYAYGYLSYIPTDFPDKVWSEDNPNAYFPRPMERLANTYYLKHVNDRYLQNMRYLRLKNVTVGYTLPQNWTRKAKIEKLRVYFTGENLHYWSALKKNSKYVDPEAAYNRSNNDLNNAFYPWSRTFMFGLDITI